MTLTRELDDTLKLCKAAGQILMKHYDADYSVDIKSDKQPVTEADRESNEFITQELRKKYPGYGILAEESKDDLSRLEKKRVWLVDPMDGTREFIDKVGEFAVMIGLVEDGRPILGAVFQPTTDSLFAAVKGEGAWVHRGQEKMALSVSDISTVEDMRLVVSRSHRAAVVDDIKQRLKITKEVASGSVGLKVGLLSQSRSDLYLHPNGKTKEWDTCAPELILSEAGGIMTDCWGEPLTYNKEDVLNSRGFVASNGQAHQQIVDQLKPFLDQI